MAARRWLRRFDDAIAAGERALIVVLCALMAGAVFLDAMHRTFSAEEGRLERLIVALLPAGAEGFARAIGGPVALALATFGVAYGALRTRNPGGVRRRALAIAAGATAALAGAAELLVRGLPNGLVWSQQMALCFMLWVGLLGASLGAREHAHIAFELAAKIWPARLRPAVGGLARALAAGFCLFLALLAALYAREHHLEWSSSGGDAGLFEAFRIPRFLIFGFLPLPMAAMGLRFAAYGVRAPEGSGGLGGLVPDAAAAAGPAGPTGEPRP
jgi:C4-dicarboxylate transporter DctQ subunit